MNLYSQIIHTVFAVEDNINHKVLIQTLNKKIKDTRLLQLIQKFLKAGYMENWKYNSTYSGCPQGGILSPILANVYLNELDKFVEKLKMSFDKRTPYRTTPEYNAIQQKSLQNYVMIRKSNM